ncbi:MAG: dihydrofolate reductase family protein [Lachnospirales bacterium]
MRTVSLFIAMSLDGYIADSKGRVDWLQGQGKDEEQIDSYLEFIKEMDTVLMGWNTYHQIVEELSPKQWIYDDLTTYVVTHKNLASSEKIRFTDSNPAELIRSLKKEKGKGIWICGGANLISQLIKENCIDYYYITVIPTLLGSGIRLFEPREGEILLKLRYTRSYNGMIDLVYERR